MCSVRPAQDFLRSISRIPTNQFILDTKKKVIRDATGLSNCEVQHLFEKCVSFHVLESQKILGLFEFLTHNGVEMKDVVKNPIAVFSLPEKTLKFRVLSLKELGFMNVTADYISRYKSLMHMKMKYLHLSGTIRSSSEFHRYLNHLEFPENMKDDALEMYCNGSATLESFHLLLVSNWLRYSLEVDEEEAERMIKAYRLNKLTVQDLTHRLIFLKKALQIDNYMMKSRAYLLLLDPEQVENFLKLLPCIAGIPTVEVILKLPRLLFQSPSDIKRSISILRKYGISNQIVVQMILSLELSPEKLSMRLMTLKTFKGDSQSIQSEMTFLHSMVNYRLIAKAAEKDASLSDPDLFSALQSPSWKVVLYELSKKLNLPLDLLCTYLKQHPNYRHLRSKNATSILQMLQLHNFTTKQIVNGLDLMLYSQQEVEKELASLEKEPELQPNAIWKKHDNYLQFLLYKIEAQTNFANISKKKF